MGQIVNFNKPPLTIDQQIAQLADRGLAIPDRDRAAHYLVHLNYYRLRAYWLPLEQDSKKHVFRPGANFEQALDLYVFDRKLRLLVLDAIERIEVSLRTQWAYYLAHAYGPHAYLDVSLFNNNNDKHSKSLASLTDEITRSDESFVRHYLSTYTHPPLPPIWAACELLSLGQLSRWYSALAKPADRQAIARCYRLDEKVLTSFFHHLTTVRNLCAHHSRVWNRHFVFTFKLPRRPIDLVKYFNPAAARNLYSTLVLIRYLLAIASPDARWEERLVALIDEHSAVDPGAMGFPVNWKEMDIWHDGTWKAPS